MAENSLLTDELPRWIPRHKRDEFINARDRLLGIHGISLSDLQDAIDDVLAVHAKDMLDPAYASYERQVRAVDEIAARREKLIRLMARVVHAMNLGETDGLPVLMDQETAGQVTHGRKFRGRKPDSIGPVRKFIRAKLKKNPSATNEELWDAISKRPPKDWTPIENARLWRYIEGPSAADEVKWKSFCTYASIERKRLNNP